MITKDEARRQFFCANHQNNSPPPGKIAEQLRQAHEYKRAKELFVGPAPDLMQIRTNALADGKRLVMPSAGLKEGLYLLKPYEVPFQTLSRAVTCKGLSTFGTKLDWAALGECSVDLLITDALAIDPAGFMVGDGNGFFDLALALLAHGGALAEVAKIFAVVQEGEVLQETLRADPWDVAADGILTSNGLRSLPGTERQFPGIMWDALPLPRIKRIRPLWRLFRRR